MLWCYSGSVFIPGRALAHLIGDATGTHTPWSGKGVQACEPTISMDSIWNWCGNNIILFMLWLILADLINTQFRGPCQLAVLTMWVTYQFISCESHGSPAAPPNYKANYKRFQGDPPILAATFNDSLCHSAMALWLWAWDHRYYFPTFRTTFRD